MPSVLNAASKVRRHRRAPAGPKSQEELPTFLFSEEAIDAGFYRFDINVDANGRNLRHFAFMKDGQLPHLRNAKEIKVDSTFKLVGDPFYQLMSIQCVVNMGFKSKTYPLGYVLMSGKRQVDYEHVFERLKTYLQHGDQRLKVKTVLMDFERAAWNAVKKVFPDVKVRGCWFHFCQAIYRKAKNLGLSKAFQKKRDVNLLIRQLMNLALMDVPAIPGLFETLKKVARRAMNEAVNKLIDYVERYWINGVFTPADWSCYGYDIRTNNEIESWNGKLWIKADRKALNIYLLAQLLFQDATRALRDMHRKESNQPSRELQLRSKQHMLHTKMTNHQWIH